MKNQIDYQTQQYKVFSSSSAVRTFTIPLPINCILKAVSVEAIPLAGTSAVMQAEIKLIEETKNSNIKVSHQLAMGSIYNSGVFSSSNPVTYYNKTLSYLYDHPIQKEGISIEINIVNASPSSNFVNVHWQVKNMEGGI